MQPHWRHPSRRALALVAIVIALASAPPGAAAARRKASPLAEIPFEIYRRWAVLEVQVEDSPPLRFIFDTGAPVTVVADGVLARTLQLNIVGEVQIGGAGDGPMPTVQLARDVRLRVGGLDLTAETVAVGLGSEAIAGTDGIIGNALLQDHVVEIDWQAQRLRLYAPKEWEPAAGGAVLPLRRLPYGHLATSVHVSIDGRPEQAVDLVVDTGAGHALSLETAADLAVPAAHLEDVVLGWGANGRLVGDIGRISELRLGPHVLAGVVTTFPTDSLWGQLGGDLEPPVRGNLGAQALQRFGVAIDVHSGRLVLRPTTGFDAVFPFDQAGMALRPFAQGADFIEVADVISGSPAEEAGVRTGDRIAMVQGQPVTEIAPDELLALLEGGNGQRLRLAWMRGDERFEAELRLRPLI